MLNDAKYNEFWKKKAFNVKQIVDSVLSVFNSVISEPTGKGRARPIV